MTTAMMKFSLGEAIDSGDVLVSMPEGASPLAVWVEDIDLVLFARCPVSEDEDPVLVTRSFRVAMDGDSLPGDTGRWIGTIPLSYGNRHVFEVKPR